MLTRFLPATGKRQEPQPQWPSAGEDTTPRSGRPGDHQLSTSERSSGWAINYQGTVPSPIYGDSELSSNKFLKFHPFQDGWHRPASARAKPGSVVFTFLFDAYLCIIHITFLAGQYATLSKGCKTLQNDDFYWNWEDVIKPHLVAKYQLVMA